MKVLSYVLTAIGAVMIVVLSVFSYELTSLQSFVEFLPWWLVCICLLAGALGADASNNITIKRETAARKTIVTTIKISDREYMQDVLEDFEKLIKLVSSRFTMDKSTVDFVDGLKDKHSKTSTSSPKVSDIVWLYDARDKDVDKTKITDTIIHDYTRRILSKPCGIAVSEFDIGAEQFNKLVKAGIPVVKTHYKPLPKKTN